MAKKKSASSRREKRVAASVLLTTPVTNKKRRDLKRIVRKRVDQIDYSDAPDKHPLPAEVHIGRFYRPIKQLVSHSRGCRRPSVVSQPRQTLSKLYERSASPRDAI